MDLRPLTDETLLARLDALVSAERESLVDVIEHLMEIERRECALDKAYPSLFEYCTRKLKYSEQAAFARIRAARAAIKFPEILERLKSGALHLDAVVRLYPVLSDENKGEILAKAAGASKLKVLALVADLKGSEPAKPDRFVILAKPKLDEPWLANAQPPDVIPPPRRIRMEFEADESLLAKVDRLKALLRNKYPFIRLEELFTEAADALLRKLDPSLRKPKRPRAKNGRSKTRAVPEAVKREVWTRDGGRCAYVAADGRRCESVDALQYDHVTPYALGGASDDPANIRLLCRPHNQRLARKRFGPRLTRRSS